MKILTSVGRVLYEAKGDLAGADLRGLNLSGAALEGILLAGTDFSGNVMNGAMLENSDLRRTRFVDTTMEGAQLMDASLEEADLRSADLYWAAGWNTSFRKANLTSAKLNGAILKSANFTDAVLENTDFSRDNLGSSTVLHGANFTGAALRNTNFDGAEYTDKTVFPEDFGPKQHGMVWVEVESDSGQMEAPANTPSNLLQETLDMLKQHQKTGGDVRWVGSHNGEFALSWSEFAEVASRTDYSNGGGFPTIAADLVVVGADWWLERNHANGAEWWDFKMLPVKMNNPQSYSAISSGGWFSLKQINDSLTDS